LGEKGKGLQVHDRKGRGRGIRPLTEATAGGDAARRELKEKGVKETKRERRKGMWGKL